MMMSSGEKHVRRALSRARWSVIQTGLITTALTLFGVYVLANRSADEIYAMDWYVQRYVPIGALLVGLFAASGYLIGAHWTGLRVRGWLLITVLAFQLAAYWMAHYAQFAPRNLRWRNTDDPVSFFAYFKIATLTLGIDSDHNDRLPLRMCIALRALEAFLFVLPAVLVIFVHLRRRPCATCGGVTRDRLIGAVSSPGEFAHLTQLAAVSGNGDARAIEHILRTDQIPSPTQMRVTLSRCVVCGNGSLRTDREATAIKLSPQLADKLWACASLT